MAQKKKSVFYKNAVIDTEAGTITEITKDGENEYQITDVLAEWDGVEGVTIAIQQSEDF